MRKVIDEQTIIGFCPFFYYYAYPSPAHLSPLVDIFLFLSLGYTWGYPYLKWFYVFSFFHGLKFHHTYLIWCPMHISYYSFGFLLLLNSVLSRSAFLWLAMSCSSLWLPSTKSLSHLLLFLYVYFPGLHPLSLFLKDSKQACISLNHVIVPVAKYFILHRLFATAIHLKLWFYHQKKKKERKKKEETKLALDSH